MTAVIRMYEQGTRTVLRHGQETIGEPCHDQVLVRQAAIGVNHADADYRNGSAHIDRFPFINGFEAAGTVEATGPDVRDFRVGDRVAYHFAPGADYVIATVRQPETSSPVHRRELQRRTRYPQPVHV